MPAQPAGVAVTWLFVPGDRPERYDKAAGAGADAVIIDVEDAVAADAKDAAVDAAAAWLTDNAAWVRINSSTTPWHVRDVARLADSALTGLQGVIVPMAEDPASVASVSATTGRDVIALIETARGLDAAASIAEVDGVVRLAFGSIDFALDIDAIESRESLLFARSTLVVASRLAGLPAPIDAVTANVKDPSAAADDARHARGLGFGGKLCIHPSQIAAVRAAFVPSDAELRWATGVLAAAQGAGAAQVDGMMIDEPVLARARRVLGRRKDE